MLRKRHLIQVFLLAGALIVAGAAGAESVDRIEWEDLPSLPQAMSGQFVGVHHEALIVAGGTHWPKSPFQGGTKAWLNGVYVLERGAAQWREAPPLERAYAYGVAVSTEDGVVCIGGSDGQRHARSAFRLSWDNGSLRRDDLPDLPAPCAYAGAALMDNVVYVVGGQEAVDSTTAMHALLALDLGAPEPAWERLEPWPGPSRILPVVVSQDDALYVFSGAELTPGPDGAATRTYLDDGYCYRPAGGWSVVPGPPRPVVAAPATAFGPAHILVFSGDDGELADRIQELGDSHPGFPKSVLTYHTITGTWAELGLVPESYVTTAAVLWEDGFVVPGGEDRPGHRGARVLSGRLKPRDDTFGWPDHAAMVLYFVILVAMGVYFSKREKSTEDFFLGGRRVPWWAAGISIFGTLLSAITFLSVPSTAFAKDWIYYIGNLSALVVAPIVVYVYLPFFRRATATSAYEYLEKRFSLGARLFGSAAFVLFQLGRVGIVLLLPALALSAATGIDKFHAIAVMGILCTFYTVLGGIEAVIWTDVIQVVILLGGALLALGLVVTGVDGGLGAVVATGWADDKFRMFNWTWDYSVGAAWVVVIGRTLENLIPYTTDQTVIQRYLTTSTDRQAAKSVWLGVLISAPVGIIFFAMGTALYVYYKTHPELLDPSLQTDAILPLFIVQHFPAGVAGLVIAAVFAAAMSSLDSSLNSVSTVIVTDYYRRFRAEVSERGSLVLARALTVMIGALGTGMALFMARADIPYLWELYMEIIGLFGGALAGLFALGIFTRRANGVGALVGVAAGTLMLYVVKRQTSVSFLLYSSIGIFTTFATGYVASLIANLAGLGRPRDLAGLTWPTRNAGTPGGPGPE